MTSILTNTSAMNALQTLKTIGYNLNKTQEQIASGKSIGSAADNAAIWAISKVMESDVVGFNAIEDSLNLGLSTVSVAREGADSITNLLTEMKERIVSGQTENLDADLIQADVDAYIAQIQTIVKAVQFNGLNLIDGTSTDDVNVLSSLDRASDGTVTSNNIAIVRQNLATTAYAANTVFTAAASNTTGVTVSGGSDTFVMSLDSATGVGGIKIQTGGTAYAAGDSISIRIGSNLVSYTVTAADVAGGVNGIPDLIAVGLKNAIDNLGIGSNTTVTTDDLIVAYDAAIPGELQFTNNTANALTVTGQWKNVGAGGLSALSSISVVTDAATALASIETLIQTAIAAAAAFGSVEKRIEIQAGFVGKLSDALTTGVGVLVDADMEEVSARLQALQVQQQLGIQALSIANSAPQNVLALFQ